MRPKLLFVGDATLRKVWQVLFAGRGWQVASASTADEGLASLDPAPDYLILDLRLPDAGGEAVLRRVREAGLKTRVTVIAAPDGVTGPDAFAEFEPESLLRGPIDVARIWREGVLATAR